MDSDEKILIPAREIERMSRDFAGAYDPLSIQLFFAIRALGRRINDAVSAWLAPFGLTATKYNYLAVLYANRERGVSPSELGAVVHTVSGTVASMINALEKSKLITRTVHHADRRSAVIRLTKRGEHLFRRAASVHHANLTAVARTLGTSEAERLLHDLLRLGRALDERAATLDAKGGKRARTTAVTSKSR
jgi:DNA-binding MarR family transcriptional regulator